jgi:hypothetical protein
MPVIAPSPALAGGLDRDGDFIRALPTMAGLKTSRGETIEAVKDSTETVLTPIGRCFASKSTTTNFLRSVHPVEERPEHSGDVR